MFMLPIFIFIIKVILVSGILVGYYWLSLRNTRFHRYNRFYLVGSVLISVFMPLLDLNLYTVSAPRVHQVQEVVAFINQPTAQHKLINSWDNTLFFIMLFVSVLLLLRFCYGIFQIYSLKSKCKVIVSEKFDFVETSLEEAPFSFFRNLFWRNDILLSDETGQRMLKHELTHIEEHHSFDRVILSIATFLFWMNPFYWIIKSELEVVQEFIADEKAIEGSDASLLADMLITAHIHPTSVLVGQSFFYSSIKRRIIMLSTSKKVSYSYARRILVLPIAIGILGLLSLTVKGKLDDSRKNSKSNASVLKSKLDTIPPKYLDPQTGKIKGSFQIDVVGDIVTFKDVKTKKKLFAIPINQLNRNVTITQSQSSNINSNNNILFVTADSVNVLDKGKPSAISIVGYKIEDTSSPVRVLGHEISIDKQEDRTIMISSDKVIAEKSLRDDNTVTINIEKKNGKPVYYIVKKNAEQTGESAISKAVYILDGKEIDAKEMNLVDPSKIESISVLKDKSATATYGEKGKNGVVLIKLKN
jgi:TonB-dependent SusC/RagA subfamily outer membrane receptor